jgi:hypothetical protein
MDVVKQNLRQIERIYQFLITLVRQQAGLLKLYFTLLELIHPSNTISSPGQR